MVSETRMPVVAGQFYTADPDKLQKEVDSYLARGHKTETTTLLAMVPHAGYMFSGKVAGKTFGSTNLTEIIYLLGPNHTGRGASISVWSGAGWQTPLGTVEIAKKERTALLATSSVFQADTAAHIGEHSLEVLLPFIQRLRPEAKIIPIAIASHDTQTLTQIGSALANALLQNSNTSLIVSSDMSHYVSADFARQQDSLALDQVASVDPLGLYNTVTRNNISMCGVLPMTCGLTACKILGATKAQIVEYATSGDVTGDMSQVVGYAGAIIERPVIS